ncbi:M1 family metallopeptidase [Flagellimonas pacifica]|uniref:Aminopeptidase N n=1 Tax=Flagellimonas pacifica TaxID=1247520 RepID=A0A285MX72_9FLAO|nr:M1 family metallopeptidase [Allomuricauda parva]SNZ00091.1 aminopeptidase N [Allomuricauda parva]
MKLGLTLIFFLSLKLLSAQIQDDVDFKFCGADIYIQPNEKKISGRYSVQFWPLKNVDSIFLDAHDMSFNKIRMSKYRTHKSLDVKIDPFVKKDKLIIKGKFEKGAAYTLRFEYRATPSQTVYFSGWDDTIMGNEQVWTQGQGKYTSHWLPSLDDMNDKIEFDLNFILDENYTVVSNGRLMAKDTLPESHAFLWKFDMEQPMSSYLVGFAIGNFDKKTIQSTSGISVELYYEPKDSLKVEPTYRYTKEIFNFLENEIGVPYPWQNYKQVPVHDFLYAGMENTGATIFSNTFVVDSTAFMDKNFVNVNAHEMAHQWFGNLVTEQGGKHHWLHEGFATYYAYLAEKDIFGEDYFYWRLLETAWALDNFSGEGNGEALIDSGAGSLTFYEKGAWALVMLRERVGDSNFKQGIQNYLTKYAYQNVTISDFIWEMEKASGMKLMDFEEAWLQESEFPFEAVKTFLIKKNKSINEYFEIKDSIGDMTALAESILKKKWGMLISDRLKHQVLLDYGNELSAEFIKSILNNESLKVRQAVAFSLEKVSADIQTAFENLLMDESYKTIESALYRLWTDFPEQRNIYLNKTAKIIGLPNKNVRLLWLTLALVTPEYQIISKPDFFKELSDYTSTEHHFEVRLLAFQYLKSIGAFNDETVKNLIKACNHHVWHFKKSCRKMLKEFWKEEENKERLKNIYPTLSLEQQKYIDKTFGK